jgi:hypothetical protein
MTSRVALLAILSGLGVIVFGDASFADFVDGTSNTITFPAPGPIVGAGLPGLVVAGIFWVGRKIWNRRAH